MTVALALDEVDAGDLDGVLAIKALGAELAPL